MTHEELRDLTAAYALGALPDDERREVEAHLAQCEECAADARSFAPALEALALDVEPVAPPAHLRARVLGAVSAPHATAGKVSMPDTPARRAHWGWNSLALAAAAVLVVAVGLYAAALRSRLADLERAYADANARAQAALHDTERRRAAAAAAPRAADVLSAPDVVRIDLRGQSPAERALARALWSRARGMVFGATDLPELPAGKVYQLWVVTGNAAISAGLLQSDGTGHYSLLVRTDPNIPQPVALAVTVEPAGGVPAPTGPKYLVGAP